MITKVLTLIGVVLLLFIINKMSKCGVPLKDDQQNRDYFDGLE